MKKTLLTLFLLLFAVFPTRAQQTQTVTVTSFVFGVVTSTLPAATVNSPYSQTIIVSGGKAPYIISIPKETCNLGVSGSAVTGTPTNVGPCTVSVTATDSSSPPIKSLPVTFTLTVNAAVVVPLQIATPSIPNATVGVAITSIQLTATGGVPSSYKWTVISGALPAGESLNAATGAITGTPTTPTPDTGLQAVIQLTSN